MAPKTSIKRISTAPEGRTASPRKKTIPKTAPATNPARRSAVSAQKREEKGWRGSEKAFHDVFDKSVIGKSLTRPDGSIRVNKALADMLGYSRQEVEGRNWRDYCHPDDLDKTQKKIDVLLSGEAESVRFTKRYIHKDGHTVWADLGSTLRRDENGRPLYLITDIIDITERKHAEEILQASEATFAALFQANASALALTRIEDGRILDVNENWLALMGFRREEVLGKTAAEYGGWKNPADREEMRRALAETGSVRNYEALCVRKGGEEITILFSAHIVEIERERILLSSAVDISARKQMEEALRESRDRLDLALQSAGMGIWTFDIPAGRRTLDEQTCRILGLDPAGFTGTPEEFFGAIHPDDRPMVRDALAWTIEGNAPYDPSYRVVHPDGHVRHVVSRGRLTRGPDGRPLKIHGILWDDTERRRAEEALAAERSLLHTLIDNLPDNVFIKDTQGGIILNNPAHRRFLGRQEPDEVVGKTDRDFFAPVLADRYMEDERRIVETGQPLINHEEPTVDREGRLHWYLTTKVPVRDHQGKITALVGINRDITERKQAEDRIQQSLREKEILLREVYHRTKNNMNVITAMLSLRGESCLDEAAARALKDVEDRIRAMALVHQMFYQSQDLSRIDIRDYLIELASLLRKTAPSSAGRIVLDCQVEPLRVPIDTAIPLGMIFTELFSNVFKHAAPDNAEVRVRLHLAQSGTGEIELTFSDDGIGVPTGFDFRACETLGLQTVFMLVEHQLQGQVDFQSGRGVSCRIRIPAPALPEEART